MAVKQRKAPSKGKMSVRQFRSMVPASIQPVTLKREEGKPIVVQGYGAVFFRADNPGTEYWLYDDLVERIGLPAFDRAIQEKDDARGLQNHDVNLLMGRVAAGTCRLSVDAIGLRYEFDLPDSPNGQNLLKSLERGDITGSSFSFDILPGGAIYRDMGDYFVREITNVRLYDVGPVTFPAYTAATAGLRSAYKPISHGAKRSSGFDDREEVRQELRTWLAERGPTKDQVEVELAMARAKVRMTVRA